MGIAAAHGSKLFHTIVVVGSAFGAACGGATETGAPAPSRDASSEARSDGPRDGGSEVGEDAIVEMISPDASDAARVQDGALGVPDGRPDARGFSCCPSGNCFPCFV